MTVEAARLPIVSGDSNNWGTILNTYLSLEHTENGTHKNITVLGNANITGILYVLNLSVNNTLTVDTIIINKNLVVIGNITNTTVINVQVNGSLNASGNVTFTQLKNCNTIDTDANGLLTCGVDETGADASSYNLLNFTSNYNARADRFGNSNFTAMYDSKQSAAWRAENNTDATIPNNITINTTSPATFSSTVIFVSNVTFLGNVNLSIFNNIVNNLIPSTNGTNSLGNATNRWSIIYAVNLSGRLNCLDLYGGTDADFCSDSTSAASIQVVNGSGTLNFLPKWLTNVTLGNSTIFDNGNIGIGTISPTDKLTVNGTIKSSGDICTDAGSGKCLSTSLTAGANGTIPSGMIAMFDTACPTGWTRFAALDSRFPKGAAIPNGTGGVDTHNHGTSFIGGIESGGGMSAVVGLSASNHTPPYVDLVFCKKN